jgi:hypothetical protein
MRFFINNKGSFGASVSAGKSGSGCFSLIFGAIFIIIVLYFLMR